MLKRPRPPPAPAGPCSVNGWPWQPASRSPRWGRRGSPLALSPSFLPPFPARASGGPGRASPAPRSPSARRPPTRGLRRGRPRGTAGRLSLGAQRGPGGVSACPGMYRPHRGCPLRLGAHLPCHGAQLRPRCPAWWLQGGETPIARSSCCPLLVSYSPSGVKTKLPCFRDNFLREQAAVLASVCVLREREEDSVEASPLSGGYAVPVCPSRGHRAAQGIRERTPGASGLQSRGVVVF